MDQFSSIREYSGIRWEEIYTVEVDRVLQKNKKDIDNVRKDERMGRRWIFSRIKGFF